MYENPDKPTFSKGDRLLRKSDNRVYVIHEVWMSNLAFYYSTTYNPCHALTFGEVMSTYTPISRVETKPEDNMIQENNQKFFLPPIQFGLRVGDKFLERNTNRLVSVAEVYEDDFGNRYYVLNTSTIQAFTAITLLRDYKPVKKVA